MDESGGNSNRTITNYEQLKALAMNGNRAAIMLVQLIENELNSKRIELEVECKKENPDMSFEEVQRYVNSQLSTLRENLTNQYLATAPNLQKQVETQKEKTKNEENGKSRKKGSEAVEELRKKKQEENKDKASTETKNEDNSSPQKKSKTLMDAHPVFKDLLKSAPVAQSIIEEFDNEEPELSQGIKQISSSTAGDLLMRIINQLMSKPNSQVKKILIILVEMHPESIELLSPDQKIELGNMLKGYVKHRNLINPEIEKRISIKNCAEILPKFKKLAETNPAFDFTKLSTEKQYAWDIVGTAEELISSGNSLNNAENIIIRKRILENDFHKDETEIEESDELTEKDEEDLITSMLNHQARIRILDNTPIEELSKKEILMLDQNHPGIREYRTNYMLSQQEQQFIQSSQELFQPTGPSIKDYDEYSE